MNEPDSHTTARPKLRLLAVIALAVVFGWQVLYQLDRRQHSNYRTFLGVYCGIVACEIPLRRDLQRMTLTHTRVDLHPLEPGALKVTVKLVNEATFAQPYPDLQVTLTDRNGRVVGRRTYPSGCCVAEGLPNRLDSGELGVVQFELARPNEKAVGFAVNLVAGRAPS